MWRSSPRILNYFQFSGQFRLVSKTIVDKIIVVHSNKNFAKYVPCKETSVHFTAQVSTCQTFGRHILNGNFSSKVVLTPYCISLPWGHFPSLCNSFTPKVRTNWGFYGGPSNEGPPVIVHYTPRTMFADAKSFLLLLKKLLVSDSFPLSL